MRSWVLRRLLGAVPLVLGVATLVFLLVDLVPGDPASVFVGPRMSAETLEQIRRNLGLDRSLPVRYGRWLAAVVTGDFGYSLVHGVPVRSLLASALPNTLLLSGAALLLTFLAGTAIGVVQAVRRGGATDSALSVLTIVFYSVPSFWLGIVLILVFSLWAQTEWGWAVHFPASGTRSVGYEAMAPGARLLDRLWHLVLPLATLVLVLAAGVARYVRASVLEQINREYVRTARAKGLSERTVLVRHVLRNALLPLLTLLGLYLPILLSGTVFVEAVFQWPGMGLLVVDAIGGRDYPVILAATLLFGLLVVVGNLLADVLYAWADPRIRHR